MSFSLKRRYLKILEYHVRPPLIVPYTGQSKKIYSHYTENIFSKHKGHKNNISA
jgi:hypothetical protein